MVRLDLGNNRLRKGGKEGGGMREVKKGRERKKERRKKGKRGRRETKLDERNVVSARQTTREKLVVGQLLIELSARPRGTPASSTIT